MPPVEECRRRFIDKLREILLLDHPELDFGLFRVMHAGAEQLTAFLEIDLPSIIADALDLSAGTKKVGRATNRQTAAGSVSVANPNGHEPAMIAEPTCSNSKDVQARVDAEREIYEHLHDFFQRCYDGSRLVPRPVRDDWAVTAAKPPALSANGSEVQLVWTNMDQYYVQTPGHLTHYSFDLKKAVFRQLRRDGQSGELSTDHDATVGLDDPYPSPLHVRFRIVDTEENENGHVKPARTARRFFVIRGNRPVEIRDGGSLVVNFEYRLDPLKTGSEGTWQRKRNAEAVQMVLQSLEEMDGVDLYRRLLNIPAPTAQNGKRPLLAKHVDQFTTPNARDRFIHKNLGRFLRRELDQYIKNEVLQPDDPGDTDVSTLRHCLAKAGAVRAGAEQIIALLAGVEDFQKKLWLKKPLVIETNYCMTLDRVPEHLYPEVAANSRQREEWVKLFAIDDIQETPAMSFDQPSPGYSEPLTTEFLKSNPYLVLDTRFFDDEFKYRLVNSIDNLERQCDGLLIHSDNFRALNLLQQRYREQVTCVYIDPPYNTEAARASGKFIYEDSFDRSSWLTMMADRLRLASVLATASCPFYTSIDEHELSRLNELLQQLIGDRIGIFTWVKKAKGSHLSQTIRDMTEYVLAYCRNKQGLVLFGEPAYANKLQPLAKKINSQKTLRFPAGGVHTTLPDGHYEAELYGNGGSALRFVKPFEVNTGQVRTAVEVQGPFVWTQAKLDQELQLGTTVFLSRKFGFNVLRHDQASKFKRPSTILGAEQGVGTNETAFEQYTRMFGAEPRGIYPKPVGLVAYLVRTNTHFDREGIVLDFFAGSGTTAHAVMDLNRQDGGSRKYILTEAGNHFNTVLKPRLLKAVYSDRWDDGKPTRRQAGTSHCFKYIRLESHDDTLRNLSRDDCRLRPHQPGDPHPLHGDFVLDHGLNVEAHDTQSPLNINTFSDPESCALKLAKPRAGDCHARHVDLLETFNYLIGLRVTRIFAPERLTIRAGREVDRGSLDTASPPAVDDDVECNEKYKSWFRGVEGWIPADPVNANSERGQRVLIVWRKLTHDVDKDHALLDLWLQKHDGNEADAAFDLVYVNGIDQRSDSPLELGRWTLWRLEDEFRRQMWSNHELRG